MPSRPTPPRIPLLLLASAALGCGDAALPTAAAPAAPNLNVSGAATCVVTSTADAGAGSLRAMIADAACSTITFDLPLPATIELSSGELVIARDVTIIGPSDDWVTVDAKALSRVLFVFSGNAAITRLTFTGGQATSGSTLTGAGITYFGNLTLTDSRVTGNYANGDGGGLAGFGTLVLDNTVVSGNAAAGAGGGVYGQSNNPITLINSTVSGNSAGSGGGISTGGPLTIIGSTVANNAAGFGGGLELGSEATLIRSTVSGNAGGGIQASDLLTLTQSTVTANTGSGVTGTRGTWIAGTRSIVAGNLGAPDIEFADMDATYSLIGTSQYAPTGFGSVAGVTAEQLQLGPLANNGGPTQTHALLAGSIAIDAIATGVAGCGDAGSTDQRGISRPQGAGCDIGAFEVEVAAPTFDFSGFLGPVVAAPGVNVVKAGRAIPIRFSLAGDQGLAILDGVPTSRQIACNLAEGTSAVEETATAGTSTLTYDAATDQYSYIWKTEKGWTGSCREFALALSDGTTHSAQFQFTK